MPDLLLMSRVLSTLPPEYFEFKSIWESVPMEDRTIDKLIERLRLIEMRLPSRSGETAALLTKRKEKLRKEQQNSFKCFKCKSPGHLARNCGKKSGRNQDQDEDVHSSNGSETGELHGIALVCESDIPESESWIADTACSQHMTYSKKFYHSYQPFEKPIDIRVGNGDVIRAHGKGNINVEMFVDGRWQSNYLTEVWYVPELGRNLLSVGASACKDVLFIANKNGCMLKKNEKVLATGRKLESNLYVMHMKCALSKQNKKKQTPATEKRIIEYSMRRRDNQDLEDDLEISDLRDRQTKIIVHGGGDGSRNMAEIVRRMENTSGAGNISVETDRQLRDRSTLNRPERYASVMLAVQAESDSSGDNSWWDMRKMKNFEGKIERSKRFCNVWEFPQLTTTRRQHF
ncbi:hypothetical protein GE061_008556 [Apolygus lucorum]|uniref:CCHC-type domain-containing protein n=1 Tax=Apolygus lucorum TaxID=248454 RepID=A0A8S9WN06_APOLU|nr:hypothetical protein GE061_008556 [Apolygus lucorum]